MLFNYRRHYNKLFETSHDNRRKKQLSLFDMSNIS